MIAQLRGTVLEATASLVVLDVAGVGYELGIPASTASSLPAPGQEARLFTRLHVREDAMTLFGFSSVEERTLFDRLVAITGIGPRLALAVLSTYTPSALYTIVATEDLTAMAQVPGVGKKMAQRLILELTGALGKDLPAPANMQPMELPCSGTIQEASSALLSMGFTSQEAELALEGQDASLPVEQLLNSALKRLGARA